jgi:hypothetical protein
MPKTSAKELQKRKEAARLQYERRLWIEAKIVEMAKEGLSWEQIRDTLGLTESEWSPSMEFVYARLMGVSRKDLEREYHRAIIDLLLSNIPLDRESRQSIADTLRFFTDPKPVTKARLIREETEYAVTLKRHLQEDGATALEAEQLVAESLGLKNVDALRKRIQRARK